MAAVPVMAVDARCPLCGTPVLSVGRGGKVIAYDLHPVPLYRSGFNGQGFMVCDDCGTLAGLNPAQTLN